MTSTSKDWRKWVKSRSSVADYRGQGEEAYESCGRDFIKKNIPVKTNMIEEGSVKDGLSRPVIYIFLMAWCVSDVLSIHIVVALGPV